ncbi:DUF6281 family protein [Streptomyces sp. V4I23]|uniref:DUF6281 family protein n=1 Tax=Streptomyces sp. V4I23 TaxID=3042282 RepID=UPI0027D90026|nr:DUF6281 family protein [Streptomyces sp. V4I23]
MTFPLAFMTGCLSSSSTEGEGSGSCVFAVTFKGQSYLEAGSVDFTAGSKVGTARLELCADTGGTVSDSGTITAYQVKGLDTDIAIAAGSAPDDLKLLAVRTDGKLPDEVQDLIDRSS